MKKRKLSEPTKKAIENIKKAKRKIDQSWTLSGYPDPFKYPLSPLAQKRTTLNSFSKNILLLLYKNLFSWKRFFMISWWVLKLKRGK